MRTPTPLLLALALLAPPAAAEEPAAALTTVDARVSPWSSVGRVNNSAYGRCAAILLSPREAVTAAHCLYNPRSRRFLQPASIHVLFGFDRGAYGFHATVEAVEIAEGYDPAKPAASLPHDHARLRLERAVPDAFPPARPADGPVAPGQALVSAGFAQARSEVLTASGPCTLRGTAEEGVLVSDCAVAHGFSGGPVFDPATGALLGMTVASTTIGGRAAALAIPAAALRP